METVLYIWLVVPVHRFSASHRLGSEVPAVQIYDGTDSELALDTVLVGKQSLPYGIRRLPILAGLDAEADVYNSSR